jgi:hypothetical protein
MWRLVNKNIWTHYNTTLASRILRAAATTLTRRRRNDPWNLFSYDPVLFLSRLSFRSTSLYYFLIPFFRRFPFSSEVTSWISNPPPPFSLSNSFETVLSTPVKQRCQLDIPLKRKRKMSLRKEGKLWASSKKIWAKNKLPLQKIK